jgi:eukaryotic-like serine/threonine-protein kinase
MTLLPGARIGRYEVRAPLGAGGMGEVYVARDPDLERDVAIKVLREPAPSSDRVRRFIQEARAASALNHPNVAHVYEIGTQSDFRFIAMELVEGETLRARLLRSPLAVGDALDLGIQIAAGLAAAHNAGIVHRDIKPENVVVRPDGYAKILDFGLAKLRVESDDEAAATLLKTQAGIAMGTLNYMAPEQLSGREVTPAADVFSLGVVLYEMICARRPFDGADAAEIVASILSKAPRPFSEAEGYVPPKLQRVILKALAREPGERYPTAGDLLEELRQISRDPVAPASTDSRRNRWTPVLTRPVAGILAFAVIAGGAWWMAHQQRERKGAELLAEAERHLEGRDFVRAYETAVAAAAILPRNERLRDVTERSTFRATISSTPPGATVFISRMGDGRWSDAGVTPLVIPRLPFGDYVVRIEKAGYAALLRPFSTMPLSLPGFGPVRQFVPTELDATLVEEARIEPGMIYVEGGEYRLTGWQRPSDRAVELDDFLIDRFEVSNREFEEFVRAGGYRRPELWKHPFVDEGRILSFAEAMTRFRDTTTLAGPRNWSRGAPPAGLENHPVTDVTWYEAAAFAEWKGKKLPTVYQWEKASRPARVIPIGTTVPWGYIGPGIDASARANFRGRGTMPVDSLPFGISPWGAYHMAGNVAEWCRNPKGAGYALRGGGWNDAVYAFGQTGGFPGFYSSPTLGFRCVKEIGAGASDQGAFALEPEVEVPAYQPADEMKFEEIRRRYDYPDAPLAARVVGRTETADWTREEIVYTAGGKSIPAFLYIPKGFTAPYRVVHFAPAGDVVNGIRPLSAAVEIWLGPMIRSGYAVWAVVREGYIGRPRPSEWAGPPPRQSPEFADYVVAQVTELRRGLDYLETRGDVDSTKLGFVATSAGTVEGLILAGVERRYRSILLHGSSVTPAEIGTTPAASRINFAPRISGAKLMLHGRYDESAPLETTGEPLYRLLREPKRLQVYEGGHAPPLDVWIPSVQSWLDETLGGMDQNVGITHEQALSIRDAATASIRRVERSH